MSARRCFVLALAASLFSSVLESQALRRARTIWASDLAQVSGAAQEVDALMRAGRLSLTRIQRDGQFQGRTHERFDQYHDGVQVFGGQLVWQKEGGQVLSVTGNLFEGVEVSGKPAITADEASRRARESAPPGARVAGGRELVILPLAERFVLAYYLHLRSRGSLEAVFVDARSGEVVLRYDDLRFESVIGLGIGTWSDRKKMSVESEAGTNRAVDVLRPFGIRTQDMHFDFESWIYFEGETDEFLATDSDNEWEDGAVVDAHAYSGYAYDYYFERHGRNGLDDAGLVAINYVHFLPQSERYNNAFFDPVSVSMNYGDGDGERFNFFSSSLEVVAHELTHGVTVFSSGLIYANESGALNEAFSDIMGTAIEWYFEPEGDGRQRADWIFGEDLYFDFGSFIRSLENPAASEDPDHYSIRCLCPLDRDNGGVHINSGIINQAFYLMVQGGTNRTSGIAVQGLGTARMDRIESIFYRAFAFYLVPSSGFSDAREATLRAARELYGTGGVEETTVRQAWDAVGVP